jgi:hypothetical protein
MQQYALADVAVEVSDFSDNGHDEDWGTGARALRCGEGRRR